MKCSEPRSVKSSYCRRHRSEIEKMRRSVAKTPPSHRVFSDARPTVPEAYEPIMGDAIYDVTKRVLFIPDCHHPFVDKAAWALMLRAANAIQPDVIVVLGDFGDCYSISDHDKSPDRVSDFATEVDATRLARRQLDDIGAGRKIFVEGNHEHRLRRFLCKSAPALFRMMNIKDLYQLPENGWEFVEYKEYTKLGKINLTHDTGGAGQNAHRQSMDKFQGSVAQGHTHRMEYTVLGSADGTPQVGTMFGTLADIDQVDYMHKIAARRYWATGFGVGILESDGVCHINPVPIVNGRCCVFGRVVR